MRKKLKQLAITLMAVLLLAGVFREGSPLSVVVTAEAASTIKLNKTKVTLNVKKTAQLKVSGTTKKVTWSSSNKKVATVTSKGKVTAKKKGTTTITAKVGGKKYTCKVTVKQPVTSVTLNKKSYTLKKKGATVTLKATVKPTTANNRTVKWTTSNKKVATVNSKGKVTAVGNGTATITATAADGSKKKASCKITVKIPTVKVTKVALNKTSATLTAKGQTVQLTATASPSNATNKAVTWKSSNTSVSTVDSTGKVTAVANGTATITATAADGSGKSATCKITVNIPVSVTGVSLNKTSATLTAKGQTAALTATVAPSNATNKTVTWDTSNANVATVSNGVVTAVGNGTATITVTTADGAKKATCAVTVKIPIAVTGVSLNKTSATLTAKGQTVALTATVAPSNATNKSVAWSTSNANVATVSNGSVTAVSNGTATITATAADESGKKATCAITVNIPSTTNPSTEIENVNLAGGNSKVCGLFYDEIPANVDLSKITFEINGNNNSIETLGTDYEPGWNTTITIKALKAGSIQIIAKYNSTVLRTWNITVTSNWDVYVAYENWKRGVETQIWNSGMSTAQKLDALESYIKTNFKYSMTVSGCSNKYYAYETMYCDCYGASDMFGNMAKDIDPNLQVGYVDYPTGKIYTYMADAVGNSNGHMCNAVYLNGTWVGYDAQPPVNG